MYMSYDFNRKNISKVDTFSGTGDFYSVTYVNIFGNFWCSCLCEMVVSLELLHLAWDGCSLVQMSLLQLGLYNKNN